MDHRIRVDLAHRLYQAVWKIRRQLSIDEEEALGLVRGKTDPEEIATKLRVARTSLRALQQVWPKLDEADCLDIAKTLVQASNLALDHALGRQNQGNRPQYKTPNKPRPLGLNDPKDKLRGATFSASWGKNGVPVERVFVWKTVTIPAKPEHQGVLSTTVMLEWVCPVCGGPRGEPKHTISSDGKFRLRCHGWSNPCGHVDHYPSVLREASDAVRVFLPEPDAISPAPQPRRLAEQRPSRDRDSRRRLGSRRSE